MNSNKLYKQYNEYSSLSQSDRLGLRINRNIDISSRIYHPMDNQKTVALKEIGGA